MGHPRKARKQYETPPHPWNAERLKVEGVLMSKYGLKNKKEIWKADTRVKKYRREARHLLGLSEEQTVQERENFLGHLIRSGILDESSRLESVLDLTVEDILRRRLQTIVKEKGLARTAKEARMFVVHGHIALDGKKIDSPSYMVRKGEEESIDFYPSSPVAKQIESQKEDNS